MMQSSVRWCPECRSKTAHHRNGPSHGLHLVLTIVTFGLWGLVWLFLVLVGAFQPWTCSKCGK
jgi:hypothetical protein